MPVLKTLLPVKNGHRSAEIYRTRSVFVRLIQQAGIRIVVRNDWGQPPALAAMHLQMQMLAIVAVSAVAFYLALFIAVPALGVVGASIAHIIFNLVLLPASVLLFATRLRREKAQVAGLR